MQQRKFSTRALALVLTVLMAQPFALMAQSSTPQLPDPGAPGMNKEQQEQLGLQATGEVYKQMPVLPDSSPETQYVQQLGRKLAAVIPADKSWPYQFHVIPAADINAFALPGGPIFVNIGTIQAAENEAELAGVLAHEMSHVYMQHSAKQAPKATVAQIIAGLAGAVLPQSGLGNLGRMGIQIGAGSVLMKYSRKDEAQADAVGAVIMYRAGYNPKVDGGFLPEAGAEIRQRRTAIPERPPESRKPPGVGPAGDPELAAQKLRHQQQRIHAREAGRRPRESLFRAGDCRRRKERHLGTAEQKEQRCTGKLAAIVRQGSGSGASGTGGNAADVAFKQVKPSGSFTQLQQGNFTISYPDNWKTASDQNTVMIVPEQGAGAKRNLVRGDDRDQHEQ